MSNVIVSDAETVPDLKGFAAANGHDGKREESRRGTIRMPSSQPNLKATLKILLWKQWVIDILAGTL
jgi:hypothetical protein